MALTLNPATKVISVPQSDLTLVSGTLYTLDTDQFRKDVMDLLASEDYVWMQDAYNHNTAVTVAGTTYARTLEFINGYSVQFTPDSAWTVRLEGSNNNIFDVENGILVQNQVQVIPTNSAGLIVSGTGLTQAQTDQLAELWANAGLDPANYADKKSAQLVTEDSSIDITVTEIAGGHRLQRQ